MSTTTLERRPRADHPATPAAHLSFPRIVRSEWGKLMSLRSTWWTLGVALVLQVGVAALMGLVARVASSGSGAVTVEGDPSNVFDASLLPYVGLQFAQLAVVALAVLAITSEYSSGQIRSSLVAVPRRTPVLWAKTLAVVVLVVVLGVVSGALSVGVGRLIGGDQIGFGLSDGETVRILAAGPLYLVAIAALSLGVGALLRHTAGAISALVGLLLVVQAVFSLVPLKALQIISPWLPGTAGMQLFTTDQGVELQRAADPVGVVFDPWVGYGVLAAWAVLALVAAAVTLRTRDA